MSHNLVKNWILSYQDWKLIKYNNNLKPGKVSDTEKVNDEFYVRWPVLHVIWKFVPNEYA